MDPVRDHLRASFTDLIGQQCEELLRIWRRVGLDNDCIIRTRLPVVVGWLSDLLEDMVRGETVVESNLRDSVRDKLAAVRQLEATLRAELSAPSAALAAELAPLAELPDTCGLIQRERQLMERMAELQSLRLRFAAQASLAQMRTLWRRLQMDRPNSERQYWESIAASRHVTEDALKRMDAELARLRQQVLPRLRECVADCRREIADLADRCLASPADMDALRPLLESQDWSEDLLDRHEAEASRLRNRLARHAEFYTALADWQSGWTSLQALLQRLKDPAVLNNRGGVLLRLERERKRAQAAVAAKEAELLRMDAEARDASRRLSVRGLSLVDYLAGVKQRAEEEKENEARRRVEKHETTLRRELQFGSKPASPMQRRVIHNSSRLPSGACKTPAAALTPGPGYLRTPASSIRTPAATPTPARGRLLAAVGRTPASANRGGGGYGCGSSVKKFTPSKIGCGGRVEKRKSGKTSALVTAQRLLRRSVKKLQADASSILVDLPETKPQLQHQLQHQPHDMSITSSYSAFQSGVGFRSSTVLPNSAAAAAAIAAASAVTGIGIGISGKPGGLESQRDSGLSSLANH